MHPEHFFAAAARASEDHSEQIFSFCMWGAGALFALAGVSMLVE